jgi:hypothetical protein
MDNSLAPYHFRKLQWEFACFELLHRRSTLPARDSTGLLCCLQYQLGPNWYEAYFDSQANESCLYWPVDVAVA